MSGAVTLGITGIVVSGIVGPAASAWFSRRADRQRFAHDDQQRRRDDLRGIVDEAAELLGAGQTNLRLAFEAVSRGAPEPAEVRDWASRVHLLAQRLLLRLPASDPVIVAYESVRRALLQVGETYASPERQADAVAGFEAARGEFLEKARQALERIGTA